ncbi:MAG: hypothetical protein NTX73_00455 [Rhodobacterales bacterium]|nr:hypothetical protein [Rhodobacterales bacterium]
MRFLARFFTRTLRQSDPVPEIGAQEPANAAQVEILLPAIDPPELTTTNRRAARNLTHQSSALRTMSTQKSESATTCPRLTRHCRRCQQCAPDQSARDKQA